MTTLNKYSETKEKGKLIAIKSKTMPCFIGEFSIAGV